MGDARLGKGMYTPMTEAASLKWERCEVVEECVS